MTITPNPQELFTPFLPSTYNIPEEEDRQKTWFGETFSQFSDVINDKKIGTIAQATENFSGGKWFYKVTGITRNEYQAICYIPSLPNTTTVTIGLTGTPQYPIANVNNQLVITQLYGTASRPPSQTGAGDADYFSFLNQGDARVSFTMSDMAIALVTTTDLSKYTGLIYVSYLRNGL